MSMQVLIKPATKDDTERIWKFLDHAYGTGPNGTARFKYPDRWKWQFVDNPCVTEKSGDLPIWLAVKDGEIVGQMCAIPVPMKIGAQTFSGGWGCDFIVSPKCRGEGLGNRLTECYFRHFQLGVGISMAGATRHIWGRFDPVPLKPVYLYWFPIRFDKALLHHLIGSKFMPFHSLLLILGNALFSIKRRLNPYNRRAIRTTIREIDEFGDEIDALSERTYRKYGAIVKRDSVWLNWRFFRNQEYSYHAFLAEHQGQAKGYIVVRNPHPAELNLGHIVDFYADRDDLDTARDLILHAIRYLGCSVAAVKCLTSVESIERILKRCGFFRFVKLSPLALVRDPGIKAEVLKTKDDWFMTLADQDNDHIVFNLDLSQPPG